MILPTIILIVLAASASAGAAPTHAKVQPVVGEYKRVTVQDGDTLFKIARAHDVGVPNLARLNMLPGNSVQPGDTLLLPLRHILPRHPENAIVLNVPERRLYLFRDGKLVQRHAVAVGRPGWETVRGVFRIRNRVTNPTWSPPESMVEREGIRDEPVPPGPENPLGDRWIGWSASGFGFHSTNAPRSVGRAVSHGCVRLYPDQADRLFKATYVGMAIYSVYEPIKLGRWHGMYYMSASPDIYSTDQGTRDHARAMLRSVGLLPLVDPATLERVVRLKRSYPERIAGSPERILVNGATVDTSIAPALVSGHWVVPVRAVAEALGGTVHAEPGGATRVMAPAGTLTLTPGSALVLLGDRELKMPVPATLVEGRLLAPLRPLIERFGATYERRKNAAILLRTGQGAQAQSTQRAAR